MATPTIPKKEKASKLLRARRLALKAGRNASTRFGESLARSKASRLLGNTIKGNPNIPYPKGVNPAGNLTLANRALSPLGKSLLGRAGLAIQGIQTARSVFDKDDNIITSLRNVGRVARDQEALGNSELAKAYNKRRDLKINQSLDQIYKDTQSQFNPWEERPSFVSDAAAPIEAAPTENNNLSKPITDNLGEGKYWDSVLDKETKVDLNQKGDSFKQGADKLIDQEKGADALKIKQLERKGMSLQRGIQGRKWRDELKALKAKTYEE